MPRRKFGRKRCLFWVAGIFDDNRTCHKGSVSGERSIDGSVRDRRGLSLPSNPEAWDEWS